MLTTRRNDTSLLEIGCNGSGSDPGHLCPCRIALKYTATDRKYVVTERFAAHGHDLAARSKDDKEAMRRRIRSAINKIETSREGKVDAKKRRREAKARGEVTDSDASEPESTDDEESDEERAPPAWRTPAKRRDSLSGEMGDFPGRRQVTGEIEALLKKVRRIPVVTVARVCAQANLLPRAEPTPSSRERVFPIQSQTVDPSLRCGCSTWLLRLPTVPRHHLRLGAPRMQQAPHPTNPPTVVRLRHRGVAQVKWHLDHRRGDLGPHARLVASRRSRPHRRERSRVSPSQAYDYFLEGTTISETASTFGPVQQLASNASVVSSLARALGQRSLPSTLGHTCSGPTTTSLTLS